MRALASFLAAYSELAKSPTTADDAAELRLAEGLVEAGKGDKAAADSLQKFVRDFPENPRVSEAWVALAELAFHATPPRVDDARKNLQKAAEAKPTSARPRASSSMALIAAVSTAGKETRGRRAAR